MIANFVAEFGVAVTLTLKDRTAEYRHYTEGKFFRFNVDYGFSWFDQSLILTPYLGINLLGVNEYITPLDKKISLDQYLEKGYMDIFFTQYMGSVGAKLDYRVLRFGRRQSLYVSASAMLLGQLTRHPKITSKGTTITSPNRMSTFPLGCSVSIRYMF